MRKEKNIYKLLIITVSLGLLMGCSPSDGRVVDERSTSDDRSGTTSRGFDPLELPRDKEVIPKVRPNNQSLIGRQEIVSEDTTAVLEDSTLVIPQYFRESIDSLNSQAYRVQLETSKLYGEAKQAAMIAEEIFDRPVFIDYEVPYFKVRVGSFVSRDLAEAYRQKARGSGYSSAWVTMVTLNQKTASSLYEDQSGLEQMVDSLKVDSIINEYEQN